LRAWRLVFRTALLWSAAALVIGFVLHLMGAGHA
jgi:hypothetical protein